jgi:hypothetical protein
MTDLTKRIKRRTVESYGYHGRRRLVVILMPGDVIGIREERRRKVFSAPIRLTACIARSWLGTWKRAGSSAASRAGWLAGAG